MSTGEQPDTSSDEVSDSASVVSNEAADQATNDDDVIEGGAITLSPERVSWKEKHETETAKVLTYALVGILAGSLLLHYSAVTVLMLNDQKDAVDVLINVFDKWLPVISSFVGGAVTFYLTRRKG